MRRKEVSTVARAFWKGVISFGMVAIPVKMYLATQSKTPSFHYLHNKCLTRPKQVLYCPVDNEYFSTKETVRGYEYTKGEYVVIEESDFEKVPVKTAHTIDIHAFVEAKEIDPIYYYGSHYLEPEELGAKPFALLREALRQTRRVAVAKISFQRREHLCSLRPLDNILSLHTMHYQEEILPWTELNLGKAEGTAQELEMAVSLVNTMARSFQPEEYLDEYQMALEKLVQAKVEGREISAPEVTKVEIPDLMAALKASIETAQKKQAARETISAETKRGT
jgi:DNA end-binding protein Ku